jgi:hypothetical protein
MIGTEYIILFHKQCVSGPSHKNIRKGKIPKKNQDFYVDDGEECNSNQG